MFSESRGGGYIGVRSSVHVALYSRMCSQRAEEEAEEEEEEEEGGRGGGGEDR